MIKTITFSRADIPRSGEFLYFLGCLGNRSAFTQHGVTVNRDIIAQVQGDEMSM